MAGPFRGRRESIIRDESFIFIGRTGERAFDSLRWYIRSVPYSSRPHTADQFGSFLEPVFTSSHPFDCFSLRDVEAVCHERERERKRVSEWIREAKIYQLGCFARELFASLFDRSDLPSCCHLARCYGSRLIAAPFVNTTRITSLDGVCAQMLNVLKLDIHRLKTFPRH